MNIDNVIMGGLYETRNIIILYKHKQDMELMFPGKTIIPLKITLFNDVVALKVLYENKIGIISGHDIECLEQYKTRS